ncbi:MAG: hypothetical protein PHG85_06830 [Candidatus Altiarchaeota archaeon]|nr:hypothetical protein [Candidatus Altiarchaeota archaeon]
MAEINACLKCGSRNISGLKQLAYWAKGSGPMMGIYTCQDCGYEGHPFVLDSLRDYKKLLELKKEEQNARIKKG